MQEQSLIEQYYTKLMSTSTPNLILASAFREIFNRDVKQTEFSRLGKLIKLYGKWTVLESFIRAGINPNFDSASPWNYLSAICLNISKESKENLEDLEKIRQIKEKTQKLLEELNKPSKKIKIRKREYLRE